MSEWKSALDLESIRSKWLQKKDAIDVRNMMEVIALAESLRDEDARLSARVKVLEEALRKTAWVKNAAERQVCAGCSADRWTGDNHWTDCFVERALSTRAGEGA